MHVNRIDRKFECIDNYCMCTDGESIFKWTYNSSEYISISGLRSYTDEVLWGEWYVIVYTPICFLLSLCKANVFECVKIRSVVVS